jgi:hypothetical protein
MQSIFYVIKYAHQIWTMVLAMPFNHFLTLVNLINADREKPL